MRADFVRHLDWRATIGAARGARALLLAALAALPAACVAPRPVAPPNPFLGDWATQDNDRITFRRDTVVQDQKQGPGTVLGPDTCAGRFHFGMGSRSREALVALVPEQPEVREELREMLPAPSYQVAELACDRGDQTYVLLGDRRLLAIYRDGTVAALERFSRI